MAKGDIFLIAGDPGSRSRGTDPLLAGIFSRIGMADPTVAYIGAASKDSRVFFMWMAGLLKKAGAGSVHLVPLASRRADAAKARGLLQGSDVLFVSGGDVELGMRVLEEKGLRPLLAELHGVGKPCIGLSAGSIMLARAWVRWVDPNDESTAEKFPCLGLAPICCDTHAEKEDWQELKALLKLGGREKGYGIPAGAALQVRPDGSLSALGKSVPSFSYREGRLLRLADLKPD